MKERKWTDRNGYKHRALVPDGSPREGGMSLDPPDIERIDWEAVKRELHNALVDRGLVVWADVQTQQDGITGAVLRALRLPVINLYKEN